jgi:hypothetical protein
VEPCATHKLLSLLVYLISGAMSGRTVIQNFYVQACRSRHVRRSQTSLTICYASFCGTASAQSGATDFAPVLAKIQQRPHPFMESLELAIVD